MSGICGWLGADGEVGDEALASMLRTVGTGQGARHVGKEFALAADGAAEARGVLADRGVAVAIAGSAAWLSPALAAIAREQGPARALAAAYAQKGAGLLDELRGPFALAVLDAARGRALLAIDRMGIHGLCFAQAGGTLVFASSADAVAAHPAVGARIDRQAVFDYLYCHMVPAPGSIFQGVQKLLPGQYLWLENGRSETRFYWRMEYLDEGAGDEAALADKFHALLPACVERSLNSEHVGCFLSGGTDSSTVTGMLAQLRGAADSYSIGFDAPGYDEMEFARTAARHFKATAHEYYVTPQDVVEAIPRIAAAYDEPFGNASAVPTYYCARMAAQDGKRLLLAGDGGDEIFGGNARYAKQKVFEAYWALPAALRRGAIEPLALGIPGGDALPPLRKLRSYIRQARVPMPDRLETYNFLEREVLAEIFEAEFLDAIDPRRPADIAREVYERTRSDSPINRMMHLDLKQTLADNDLRKVNRMCELAGIAVRYPLLDEELVEFSAQLPPHLKVNGLKLRWFFKHALRDFLPPQTLTKTKQGFGLPFGLWLRSHPPLRELTHESLHALGRRRIVRPAYIQRILSLHESGHASYYGVIIWVMMMLEQWLGAHGVEP